MRGRHFNIFSSTHKKISFVISSSTKFIEKTPIHVECANIMGQKTRELCWNWKRKGKSFKGREHRCNFFLLKGALEEVWRIIEQTMG
jgi:hypothetical protein